MQVHIMNTCIIANFDVKLGFTTKYLLHISTRSVRPPPMIITGFWAQQRGGCTLLTLKSKRSTGKAIHTRLFSHLSFTIIESEWECTVTSSGVPGDKLPLITVFISIHFFFFYRTCLMLKPL